MGRLPSAILLLAPPALAGFSAELQDEPAVAARGKGLVATVDEVERVLVNRYGASSTGQDLLTLLLQAELLETLAVEQQVEIGPQDVAQRWEELDRQTRAAGVVGGLLAEISRQGFSPEEFHELLRISMIHEELTRRALDLDEDAAVTATQQQVWLDQEIAARGLERPAPPWTEGYVARCGDVEVGLAEYAAFLRRRLPEEQVNETCWHVLLVRGMEARLPDLAPEALERAIDADIARRRAEHLRENPKVSFEQRLGASGRTIQSLREDPSVRIAALSRLWVDRTQGEEGLKRTYQDERAYFDGRFGVAAKTQMIFLVAGRFANDLVKRTYEDADAELAKLMARVGNADDFAALAVQYSEEPGSRAKNGELGWITSADPRFPRPLCEAVFEVVNAGGELPMQGRAAGPVHLDSGSAVLWITGVRPAPSWEVMSEHVHEELRRRFIEDVMPRNEVEVEL